MTARLVTARGPSQRKRRRAGGGSLRSDLAKMRRFLSHCPACDKKNRVVHPCDEAKLSAEAKVTHDELVDKAVDHIHMKCPDCGHEVFITFEGP